MKRREFLLAVLATSFGAVHSARAVEDAITVYKSPT